MAYNYRLSKKQRVPFLFSWQSNPKDQPYLGRFKVYFCLQIPMLLF